MHLSTAHQDSFDGSGTLPVYVQLYRWILGRGTILRQHRRICEGRVATKLVGQWDFVVLFGHIQLLGSVQCSCALEETNEAMAGEYL